MLGAGGAAGGVRGGEREGWGSEQHVLEVGKPGWTCRVSKRKARTCQGLFRQHRELKLCTKLLEICSKIFQCPNLFLKKSGYYF